MPVDWSVATWVTESLAFFLAEVLGSESDAAKATIETSRRPQK